MAIEKKVSFKDIEQEVKVEVEKILQNPADHIKNPEIISNINNASSSDKKAMEKALMKQAKVVLSDMNEEDIIDAIIEDLQEDGVKITKNNLSDIIENPGKAEYCLNWDSIHYISNTDKDTKSDLIDAISGRLGFEMESKPREKIKEFFKNLWIKMSPILDEVVDTLIDVGTPLLQALISNKVKNPAIKIMLSKVVDETADVLMELDLSSNPDSSDDETTLVGDVAPA